MVAPDAEAPAAQSAPENTGTFGKIKQTFTSSLLTAQDKGKRLSVMVPSSRPHSHVPIHHPHIPRRAFDFHKPQR